jgi:PAS domain S-box-containing protein
MGSQAAGPGEGQDPSAGSTTGAAGERLARPDSFPGAGAAGATIESLDRIINCIADPIFVKDERHRLVLVNDAECALAGRSRAELLGRPDDSILSREQVDVFWRQDDHVIATGEESVSEEELADAQGIVRTVITRKTRFVDLAGNRFVVGVIRDITERKRAERALREEKALTDSLIESLPGVFFVIDVEGRLVRWNNATEAITGLPAAELTGIDVTVSIHLEDRAAVRRALAEAMERGYSEVEARVVHRDGGVRHFLFSGRPVDAGGTRFLVGTGTDITVRRQMELALEAAKSYAEGLIATANAMVLGLDVHGNVQVFNQAAERVTGYTREELVHRNWFEVLVPKERYPHVWTEFERLAAGGAGGEFENPILTKSGEERHIMWRNSTMHDRDGARGLISFGIDITERKRAEERLVALAAAVEQSADDIVVTDLAASIQYVNSAFTRTTGYSSGEALGRNVIALLGGDRGDPVHREAWETLQAGHPWQGRLKSLTKSGRTLLLDTSISPIRDGSGQTVGYVSARRDVTRQVEIEEHLVQTEKLEAIGALAGGIAHDFNNLLTVILGHLGKVTGGLGPGHPLGQSADQAHAAAQRCAALTRQLLALGRRGATRAEPLDLNACITRMAELLGPALHRDIRLVTDLAPDLGPVIADLGQVEQVVLNLVLNARDAMPGGGTLRLATANADPPVGANDGRGSPGAGRHVVLAVSDSGVGIDPQIRDRIFEPFFTTKERGQGTGLGLATVYAIVKQSGGEITVESEPGRGTTFRIHLPRAADEAARATGALAPGRGPAAARVLLVDDESGIRGLAGEVLRGAGYEVLEAVDGRDGVRVAESRPEPIDLLLTDVVMPGMIGPDMVKRIRARRPAVHVLYMSGYIGPTSDRLDLTDPTTFFLQKPFTPQALLAAVEQSLAAAPRARLAEADEPGAAAA